MLFWNSKTTTYYSRGRKKFSYGDDLPETVCNEMGKETLEEYKQKGLISEALVLNESDLNEGPPPPPSEAERLALLEQAKFYGLSPHPKTGAPKLKVMLKDYEDLLELKQEALELGIDPSDDVTFDELTQLVEEKKEE